MGSRNHMISNKDVLNWRMSKIAIKFSRKEWDKDQVCKKYIRGKSLLVKNCIVTDVLFGFIVFPLQAFPGCMFCVYSRLLILFFPPLTLLIFHKCFYTVQNLDKATFNCAHLVNIHSCFSFSFFFNEVNLQLNYLF